MYNMFESDLIWPPAFKGSVIGSQILNLILTPSFDHNSYKLGLNEQCEGTLSIYTLGHF